MYPEVLYKIWDDGYREEVYFHIEGRNYKLQFIKITAVNKLRTIKWPFDAMRPNIKRYNQILENSLCNTDFYILPMTKLEFISEWFVELL